MKYLSAKMSESLRRENERLRAEMMDACHDHALTLVGTVEMAASMHARELDGYRKREEENEQLRARLSDLEGEREDWVVEDGKFCALEEENERLGKMYADSRAVEGAREKENERLRAWVTTGVEENEQLRAYTERVRALAGKTFSYAGVLTRLETRIDAALDQLKYVESIVGTRTSLDQLRCILKGETWNPDDE